MKRLIAGVVVLGFAGVALADIAPPKGFKRVPLDHKTTAEKEYADYAFYTITGRETVAAVKLHPKNPLTISGTGRAGPNGYVQLVAVPKDAAKKYDAEKDFHAAIAGGKVEGLVKSKTGFGGVTTIKTEDARKTVTEEHKLEKIDAKEGLVVTAVKAEGKDDKPTTAPPKDPKPGEEDGDAGEAVAFTPRGGVWVAALAATAAVALAGVWLAGRRRRDVA